MPFKIIRHNIADVEAQCIVNTTSREPKAGGGADLTIHSAAGPELMKSRREFGIMKVGDVHLTPGFQLKAQYVMHVCAPVWGEDNAEASLRQLYDTIFQTAYDHHIDEVAFPLIAAGTYHFPSDTALMIALDAVNNFLIKHDMTLTLVVFDETAFTLSKQLMTNVESYISDHRIEMLARREYKSLHPQRNRRFRYDAYEEASSSVFEEAVSAPVSQAVSYERDGAANIDEWIAREEDNFATHLFKLIDERHLKDSEVYKKANIDRRLFSKIRSVRHYMPRKMTALALAIALELNLDQTLDLIGRAGYTLSHSSKTDLIIEYYIVNKSYNINEINATLFYYDCPLLGSI